MTVSEACACGVFVVVGDDGPVQTPARGTH